MARIAHGVSLDLVHRDLPGFPDERVKAVRHHLAHAASAFFTSGWDDCVVLVADGMGEVHGVTACGSQVPAPAPVQHA